MMHFVLLLFLDNNKDSNILEKNKFGDKTKARNPDQLSPEKLSFLI